MRSLTLMPKFDIIQAKCIYGFTHTPLISMNQKLVLATVVSSAFLKTQTTNQTKWSSTKTQCTSSCQQQNHRHCHVLCSRIWNWLRFHQRQRCCAPSQCPTWNGPHPRSNTNSIWQHCRQRHHHRHSCTTQIQSYGHALLLALWSMPTKKCHVYWKQGKHNLADYPSKHHSTKHHISVWHISMYSIPPKNKQKLYLNYQQLFKGVFKHICRQPLSNRWITNLQCHQWPLRQYRTNDVSLHDTFLPFRNRPSKPVSLNQRRYSNTYSPFRNKQICC